MTSLEPTPFNCTSCIDRGGDSNSTVQPSVIRHKPPKYPPTCINSDNNYFSQSPTLSNSNKPYIKTQFSTDDPFSADFEDAIGDTIVEDLELEWDHSPDTDINITEVDDIIDMIPLRVHNSEDSEIDFLPLPPPPLANASQESSVNISHNDGDVEPPLPPPPLDFDLPIAVSSQTNLNETLIQDISLTYCTGDADGDAIFMPKPMPLIPNLSHILKTGATDESQLYKLTQIKETEIDGDLENKAAQHSFPVSSENIDSHQEKGHHFSECIATKCAPHHSNCGGICDSCIGLKNAVLTETQVVVNKNVNGNNENDVECHPSGLEKSPQNSTYQTLQHPQQKPKIPLDVNVITINNRNSTKFMYRSGVEDTNSGLHSVTSPKNVNHQNISEPISSPGFWDDTEIQIVKKKGRSKSACYDGTVLQSFSNQKVTIPSANSSYKSHHIYSEVNIDTDNMMPGICSSQLPTSPILSPKKQSPSGTTAKKVLFQLPNGHQQSDSEDEGVLPFQRNSSDRHSFYGTFTHSAIVHAPLPKSSIGKASIPVATPEIRPEMKPFGIMKDDGEKRTTETKSCVTVMSPKLESKYYNKMATLGRNSTVNNTVRKHVNKQPLLNKSNSSDDVTLITTAAADSSSTPRSLKKLRTENSIESEDSFLSESDLDDDYEDVYNIDEDGLSSTSDFTSYSDELSTKLPRSHVLESDTAYSVVLEMVRSEKAYVDRLHFLCRVVLLNVKVLNNVQDLHIMPPEAVAKIFANVEKIFSLHSSTVLPLIDERIANWKSCPRIDDIMKELIVHFSLYHEYVENFNTAMTAMSHWLDKCPVFNRLILEVEKTPECRRLKVKQHLFEIVQRVPIYYDLLKSYSSHLVEGSPDRDSIKDVLILLNELVNELDREFGKTDRIKQLKSVQQRLDNATINIMSPLRHLVKEGKIKSVSSKTGKKLDRYLFLMDDKLLIGTCPGLGSKHKLKFTLGVDRMQVHDSDNLVIPFTFYVQSKTRAIEFHCGSQEEKQCWVSAIQSVIDEYAKKRLLSQPVSVIQKCIPDDDIGKMAPSYEQPQGQCVCYICKAVMKKIYNCRGCGQVVCQKCCSHKIKLQYDGYKASKVCDECFVLVSNRDLIESTASFDVPCVKPSDPCIIAGYLQISFNKGNSWHKRWLTLHSTAIMYSFKNFKESTVLGSLPVKRFMTSPTKKSDDVHKTTTFKVFNARRVYYMQADNADAMARWIDALDELIDRKEEA